MRTRTACVVAIAFCAAVLVSAQRPPQPPLVGTSSVPMPRVSRSPMPMYPQIALAARVAGQVIVQATVTPAGYVTDISVTRSIPLLDQAAIDAVRQWQFAPPTVDGQRATVLVPVKVTFVLHNGAAPFRPRPPSVRSASLPPDFDVVYARACARGRGIQQIDTTTDIYSYRYFPSPAATASVQVMLGLEAADIEAIYRAVSESRLLSEGNTFRSWPDPPVEPVTLQDTIEVTVPGQEPVVDVQSVARRIGPEDGGAQGAVAGGAYLYFIDVRTNGIWTRLSPTQPSAPDVARRLQRLEQEIEARVMDRQVMRQLPREFRLCQ